eukprot:677409-Hanusia_phi.AAC.1
MQGCLVHGTRLNRLSRLLRCTTGKSRPTVESPRGPSKGLGSSAGQVGADRFISPTGHVNC